MTDIIMAPEYSACEFHTITVTNTATTLDSLWQTATGTAFATLAAAKNKGYLSAWIHAEANVRFDPAGGTPTSTVGLVFSASTPVILENQYRMLSSMKLIREGAANVSVQVAIFY